MNREPSTEPQRPHGDGEPERDAAQPAPTGADRASPTAPVMRQFSKTDAERGAPDGATPPPREGGRG